MKLALAVAALLFASIAHADSTTLQVAGTSQLGPETVTASYELTGGILVPGSVEVSILGPGMVSFAGVTPVMSGRCNSDLNLSNGSELLQITFYEDTNCTNGGAIQPGDLGLFYMDCPKGVCETGSLDTFGQGFAYVTNVTNVPEPSEYGTLIAGIGLVALRRWKKA